ncbi:helix-turn-helix domain-containing protein [Kribbella koreensis]
MNIGEFARLGGITTRMLRHYDALGLLIPAHVDPHTSRRSYDLAQLPTLNRLLALKGLGLRLDEIGPLLSEGVDPADLHGMLRLREAELERQVRRQRHTLDRVRAPARSPARRCGWLPATCSQGTQCPASTATCSPPPR